MVANKMKKKEIFRKVFVYVLSVAVIVAVLSIYQNAQPTRVRAVGDLTVDFGVPEGDPIFVIDNMLPADTESRGAIVTNGGSVPREIMVKGVEQTETGNISTVLSFVISENGTDLYGGASAGGPKHLSDFFAEGTPNGIPLSTLGAGLTTTYTFTVTFDPEAGNEFQDKQVVFDIIIGIAGEVPAECSHIEFSGEPIYGTSGRDNLVGTPGNDLIFGFEEGDSINGNNGDDCLVGGEGNDSIRGNHGNDVILGGEGDDALKGNEGDDHLVGGSGNDSLKGHEGADRLEGGAGDDSLRGGEGDDYLDGGDGVDSLKGDEGIDTCLGGESVKTCEVP